MRSILTILLGLMVIAAVACSPSPAPAPTAVSKPANPTPNSPATETAVAKRIYATLTASASGAKAPPSGKPTLPPAATRAVPTSAAPPTVDLILSPSITPGRVLPTRAASNGGTAPTRVPTKAAPALSREALKGKILFKSTRDNGKYPNRFGFYMMDADGSNVQPMPKGGDVLYGQLKTQEGYSPDRSQLVLGESTCNPSGRCLIYIGEPSVVVKRSQGQWVPGGPKWNRADNPVWSPDAGWIAFVWNRDNDRTKNIFKGPPFEANPSFVRLTNFGGGRDTKDPSYSPDGSQLAFATQDGPRWQIWVLDPAPDHDCTEEDCPSSPHNLSNSDSDDWDPLWVK